MEQEIILQKIKSSIKKIRLFLRRDQTEYLCCIFNILSLAFLRQNKDLQMAEPSLTVKI